MPTTELPRWKSQHRKHIESLRSTGAWKKHHRHYAMARQFQILAHIQKPLHPCTIPPAILEKRRSWLNSPRMSISHKAFVLGTPMQIPGWIESVWYRGTAVTDEVWIWKAPNYLKKHGPTPFRDDYMIGNNVHENQSSRFTFTNEQNTCMILY